MDLFGRTARLGERLRFLFVPLALCALVAVGAHAAADVASGVILGFVDTAAHYFNFGPQVRSDARTIASQLCGTPASSRS